MTREGRRGVAVTMTFDVAGGTSDAAVGELVVELVRQAEIVAGNARDVIGVDVDRFCYTLDVEPTP